jgi:NADH-quinone oxidoreductase subunit C
MEAKAVFEILDRQFSGKGIVLFAQEEEGGDPYLQVPAECLVEVCEYLKSDSRLDFKMCHCVSGVDYGENLASVIHLYSIPLNHKIVVKTLVPREDPRVPSVAEVWKAANWHERETFDMLGIVYEGHPDLRRILLSDDWEGFPLRKDYPMPDDALFPWEGEPIPEPASAAAPARPTASGSESAPLERPQPETPEKPSE